jgi:hypothetical protein
MTLSNTRPLIFNTSEQHNDNCKVGINMKDTGPSCTLDVNGTAKFTQIQITGGSPGADKVLTSDADGLASWTTSAAVPQHTLANVGEVLGVVSPDGVHYSTDWVAQSSTAPSTDIIPTTDNAIDLGSSSKRFNTAYCSKIDELNEIDTSDGKLKITGSDGTHLTIMLDSGYVYFGVNMGATADSSTVASTTTNGWTFRIDTVANGMSHTTGIDHYTHSYGWQNIVDAIIPNVGHYVLWSDDRLKHNEENITTALSTIMKLKPQLYDMTKEFYDADYQGDISEEYNHMAGFIAQEVKDVPELSFCCKGEEYDSSGKPTSLQLDYISIFTHGISAIQELNIKNTTLEQTVSEQQNKINELETENITIKTALNSLLAMQGLPQI